MDQTPEYCVFPSCPVLAELRQTVRTMHDDASALQVQIDDLKASGRQARDDATSCLDLLSRVRMALNDNGVRMQDELLAYCRDLAAMPDRIRKLREGILEARAEGCACDFHLYGEDQELLTDEALDGYQSMDQALAEAHLEAYEREGELASVLPEDVGAVEYIKTLQGGLAIAQARIKVLEMQAPEYAESERERIIALLLTDKVQVWLPEASDLWPATADDLRKLLNP